MPEAILGDADADIVVSTLDDIDLDGLSQAQLAPRTG